MSPCEATTLLHVFQMAVVKIISEPNASLDTVSIATSRDKSQIRKWNAQPWDIDNRLVHQIIRETVARQPSSPAIWAWDGGFTYSELEIESTRLATQLRLMGCGTGSIVVLCFQKSIWAVVSMLAVAKTGAAFVHIDPNSPVERTKSIIQQTGSSLGLCSAGNEAQISSMLKTRDWWKGMPLNGFSHFTSAMLDDSGGPQIRRFCQIISYNGAASDDDMPDPETGRGDGVMSDGDDHDELLQSPSPEPHGTRRPHHYRRRGYSA